MSGKQYIRSGESGMNRVLSAVKNYCLGDNLPFQYQLLELFAIKYLYELLCIVILSDAWYIGYGSYGIHFVIWKELLASLAFATVAVLYLRLPPLNGFAGTVVHFLLILHYIPVNSAFAMNDTSFGFFALSNLYFLFLMLLVYDVGYLLRRHRREIPRQLFHSKTGLNDPLVGAFCAVVCVLFVLHKLGYNGLSFSLNISGDAVYTNRAAYQTYLESTDGTLYAYLLAFVRYAVTYVAPFYILRSLIRRKPLSLMLAILAVLSVFSVSSEKGKLFTSMIAVGVYVLYRLKLHTKIKRIFTVGVLFALIFCVFSHFVLKSDKIFSLLLRREMYLPSWLNTLYYDFFSHSEKIKWSQSVFLLQKLLPSAYPASPLELISQTYFNGKIPSPNTGLFAEAYMHFGALGIVVYPVLICVLLYFSQLVTAPYGRAVQTLLAAQVAISMLNVPIARTDFVLSYVLLIFVLWLAPRAGQLLFGLFQNRQRKTKNKRCQS